MNGAVIALNTPYLERHGGAIWWIWWGEKTRFLSKENECQQTRFQIFGFVHFYLYFGSHVKTNFAKHWCFWIQNSTDNSRQTIFSVKMQSTRKTNRISQFHECLENTTKCFLKTTMDFVIGIGSKEPKHRFSWGLILDILQLRSILYPLSQQKVWWISQLRRLESSSPGSSFPAEICCLISILIIYSDASESMS